MRRLEEDLRISRHGVLPQDAGSVAGQCDADQHLAVQRVNVHMRACTAFLKAKMRPLAREVKHSNFLKVNATCS